MTTMAPPSIARSLTVRPCSSTASVPRSTRHIDIHAGLEFHRSEMIKKYEGSHGATCHGGQQSRDAKAAAEILFGSAYLQEHLTSAARIDLPGISYGLSPTIAGAPRNRVQRASAQVKSLNTLEISHLPQIRTF